MAIRNLMDVGPFHGFSEKLDSLNNFAKSNIVELIWCIRNGDLSVTVCTFNFDAFESMLDGPHKDIILERVNRGANGWAVDLEYLDNPNMGKYYEYFLNADKVATGYNLNSEGIYEVKEYYQSDEYLRASKKGEEVQMDKQIESQILEKEWPGPVELINICNERKLWKGFSCKKDKDQWYMRIRDIGIL